MIKKTPSNTLLIFAVLMSVMEEIKHRIKAAEIIMISYAFIILPLVTQINQIVFKVLNCNIYIILAVANQKNKVCFVFL